MYAFTKWNAVFHLICRRNVKKDNLKIQWASRLRLFSVKSRKYSEIVNAMLLIFRSYFTASEFRKDFKNYFPYYLYYTKLSKYNTEVVSLELLSCSLTSTSIVMYNLSTMIFYSTKHLNLIHQVTFLILLDSISEIGRKWQMHQSRNGYNTHRCLVLGFLNWTWTFSLLE